MCCSFGPVTFFLRCRDCCLLGVRLFVQEQTISDKFASLSEALQVAESKAREATEMRKQVALEMARRQKMAKDEQLRRLAQQARMERGGPLAAAAGAGLAGRDTAAMGAAAAAVPLPAGGGYPGPPPSGGGGRRDASPSSGSDEDERRRAHGGSRRGREESRRDDYHDGRGSGRREQDEYEETAEVRVRACRGMDSSGSRGD